MSETINDGGPAFPCGESYNVLDVYGNKTPCSKAPLKSGMTMRDYFAGQALAGDIANSADGNWPSTASKECLLERARFYYRLADAMIAARDQS